MFTDTCTKCLRDIDIPTKEGVNYREELEVPYIYEDDPGDHEDWSLTDEVEDWE